LFAATQCLRQASIRDKSAYLIPKENIASDLGTLAQATAAGSHPTVLCSLVPQRYYPRHDHGRA
jgi:hypothetical protein